MYKFILAPLVLISRNSDLVCKRLAGHSKWQNIKHTKGLKDAQRGLLFSKVARQIKVAIQEGGSYEPDKNLKLSQVITQARRLNMPVASIENVIKTCQRDKSNLQNFLLEIKGPGGCTILAEVCSSNVKGLKMVIASVMKKHQCQYFNGGMHNFEQKGLIVTRVPEGYAQAGAEAIVERATNDAIECDVEDVDLIDDEGDGQRLHFWSDAHSFHKAQKGLEELKYHITTATIEYVPQVKVELSDDQLQSCANFYEKLEAMDEVTKLHDNIN